MEHPLNQKEPLGHAQELIEEWVIDLATDDARVHEQRVGIGRSQCVDEARFVCRHPHSGLEAEPRDEGVLLELRCRDRQR
jgi:hypothetical protein